MSARSPPLSTTTWGPDALTFPELSQNLSRKLQDRGFRDDLLQIVVTPPEGYDPDAAANVVMERLGPYLRNAPDSEEEIAGGGWRR
jgi:hypothetical protein